MAGVSDAQRLRDLHRPGSPLVLPNAWDAASAQIVERAGFEAVGTTSGGVARSLGHRDGEQAPPDEMFAAVGRIAAAVGVPVTADVEGGYGLGPAELVARLAAVGVAGFNFEDTDHRAGAGLLETAAQAERIAGLKAACSDREIDLVLNARVDVFLHDVTPPERRVEVALERARAYVAAGADCVFPIGASDEDDIRALVEGAGAPVNVLVRAGCPALDRLAELRVARVSFGSGIMRAAMARAEEIVRSLRVGDTSPLLGT